MNTLRKPRVFISRTTAGLAAVAEEIKTILETRIEHPCDIIIQSGFVPDWRTVPQMLQQRLGESDAVIALIGPAHGGEPDYAPAKISDNIPADRKFSYTQWEYLVARELKRPIFTFLVSGPGIVAPYAENDADGKPLPPAEAAQRAERQQQFIADFPMRQKELRHTYTDRALLLDHIAKLDIPLTAHAGKPSNIPYTSLGTLFKGRDTFLAELRQHLTAESTGAITGKRTIHGMGGVGKTRAAIEYAWKHADDYNALLFITGDTPDALHRNIAALCGPLVLNLPEQDEKDQSRQVEAALRWLKLHPGWFLIIDNVDTEQAADETKALLAKLSTGHVLITSRISDWTGHVKSLDLDVLSDTASIEFLDERTAERRPKRDDDQKNVATLVQLLDCLALALEQAGAHISTSAISYADYIKLWESKRPTALAWHDQEKMKYPRSLAITYETSVAQLRSGAKDLFNILAWFAPDPIPRNLLDARPNPTDERHNLSDIERLSLARYLSDGKTFTIHRLIQEITRAQQEKATTPAIPTEPPAKPQGLFAKFFGKKEQPQKAQQPNAKPEALFAALEWINEEYTADPSDSREWPIAIPLTPHAIAAANAGANHSISDPSCRLLCDCATLLMARADHRGSEPLYRKTLALGERFFGGNHPNVGLYLNNLATVLKATNRLAEAESLMRRALAILESTLDKEHPTVAAAINNLAAVLQDTNRLAEAEPLMRRALAISESSLGKEHPAVVTNLNNLAGLLNATNRFGEAEPLMRRALAIAEANFGNDHPTVATSLDWLSGLLRATSRFGEAEPLIRRALAIDEAILGKDHPIVAIRLGNLAELLKATNRLAEAEPLMRRALAIDEASFGDSHPNVARDLSHLAQLLQDTNRLAEAEPLTRRALAIDEASYGHFHPEVARDLTNLAQLLQDTNRLAEAEPLTRRALAIDEASYGHFHPEVARDLTNLAQLLKATNRLAEAEPLMRRALAISESSLGKEHPTVATNLNNLAGLMEATNRLTEAEPLMRRALAIDEASFGKDHPNIAIRLNNLAKLMYSLNRLGEAEPLMRRALVFDEAILGKDHPDVARDLNNLASLLQKTNRLTEAEPLMRRALAIWEGSLGKKHPNVAIGRWAIGQLLRAKASFAEGEPFIRDALEILLEFTRDTGHQHPHIMTVLNNYVGLLIEMGNTQAQAVEKINVILEPYGMSV